MKNFFLAFNFNNSIVCYKVVGKSWTSKKTSFAQTMTEMNILLQQIN